MPKKKVTKKASKKVTTKDAKTDFKIDLRTDLISNINVDKVRQLRPFKSITLRYANFSSSTRTISSRNPLRTI